MYFEVSRPYDHTTSRQQNSGQNFSPFLFSTILIEYEVIVPKFTEIVQNPGIHAVGIPYRTIAGYTGSLG
jgi:hypothetical protein